MRDLLIAALIILLIASIMALGILTRRGVFGPDFKEGFEAAFGINRGCHG